MLESRHGLQWLARRCSSRVTPVMRHALSIRMTIALNVRKRGSFVIHERCVVKACRESLDAASPIQHVP